MIARYEARREAAAEARRALLAGAAEPGALRDGRRVEVFANVGSAADARHAVEQGAEGVGLLRTEFLFLDRDTPPSEDEQVEVLREIADALDGRPLIVRTLDAGADKPLPFLAQEPEDNPFLGRRGIRLSLAEPELLRTQLRAILRVAAERPLKVMFPMVATLEEVRAARAVLEQARAELGSDAELEVGVMVEVPALALQAALIAPEVDFFSIGTNDLAQYTMAAERGNAALAGLLDDSLAPVLALIANVTAAAEAHGRWVGVCGELAGEPEAAVLLAGLGVRELSMAASRIPAVKAALREVDFETRGAPSRCRRRAPRRRAVASARLVGIPTETWDGLALRPTDRRRNRDADRAHPGRHGAGARRRRRRRDRRRRHRGVRAVLRGGSDGLAGRAARAPLGRHQQARLVPRHDGGQAARLGRADRAARRRAGVAVGGRRSSSVASWS